MRVVDTRVIILLALWVLGFALMTAGWLVEQLFESWGTIPAKVLHKLGAFIVAMPVIILLYKIASYLYFNRVDISLYINETVRFATDALKSI